MPYGVNPKSPSFDVKRWQEVDWPLLNPKEYVVTKYLGQGSYASVCAAKEIRSGKTVAIKRIDDVFGYAPDAKRILREICILMRLTHPNVVKIRDILEPPASQDEFRDLYIVMEYVDTDLAKLINTGQLLQQEHVKCIMLQLLAALKYMHSAHILHRDLKPENVLVTESCEVKICDFGLARGQVDTPQLGPSQPHQEEAMPDQEIAPQSTEPQPEREESEDCGLMRTASGAAMTPAPAKGQASTAVNPNPRAQGNNVPLALSRQMTSHVVTRWYRAPELMLKMQYYSTPIDMWSVGCIFAEMLRMLDSNPVSRKRKALFPGKSSWMMTPPRGTLNNSTGTPSESEEESNHTIRPFAADGQLMSIINVIGTPTPEEIEKVPDTYARSCLRNMAPQAAKDLVTILPNAGAKGLDLLQKMLKFDPDKRCTVDDAVDHPYFQDCFGDTATYGDMRMRIETIAETPVELEFDNSDDATLDVDHLKEMMREEIRKFHSQTGLPDNSVRSPVRLSSEKRPASPEAHALNESPSKRIRKDELSEAV